MKIHSLFYSQAIISIGVNVANVLNIAFMLLTLRLPAEAFAEITSILAITFVFSVSQSSARNQLLLLKKETGNLKESITRTMNILLPIAILEGVVLIALSGIVCRFLHFSSPLPFVLIAACGCTYVLNGMIQGIFAAEQKHMHHAFAIVLESSNRLPLALIFLHNGYQTDDTAWIMLLASISALAINLAQLPGVWRKHLCSVHLHWAIRSDMTTAILIMLSTLLIGIALKIDILWAKHVLTSEAAGVYGMMSFVASVLFLNSSGISRASLSFIRKDRGFGSMVAWSYGIMTMICLASIILFYIVGLPILQWISPDSAHIDLGIQLVLFIAVTGYCLINFSYQCLSVMHRNIHLILSLGLVLSQVVLFALFAYSPLLIALNQLVIMLFFGGAFSVALLHHKKTIERSAHHHGHHSLI